MYPQIVLNLCELILCKVVGTFYIFVKWHCGCKIYTIGGGGEAGGSSCVTEKVVECFLVFDNMVGEV